MTNKFLCAVALALALVAPQLGFAQGNQSPGVPYPVINGGCLIGSAGQAIWGSCSGTAGSVTSVTGTAGQVTVSPTTGDTVVSLPATITKNLTFSGTVNLTGTAQLNGTAFGTFATQNFATPPAIGGTTPAAISATTLTASSTVSGAGITALFASPPALGGTAPAAVAATTLSATSTVSGAGITALFASPPALGGTAPAAVAATTISATSTVSGAGFSTYLASPPAIGGTVAGDVHAAVLTATGQVTLSGLASGTAVSCTGINGSNVMVLVTCGGGGGGSLTVTDGTHSVSSTTTLTVGSGFLVGGSAGSATLALKAPNRSVPSGAVTLTTLDWGGQVNNTNASSPSATIPDTSTLAAGQTVVLTNQAAATMSITDSQTVNGLPLATAMHHFGFYAYIGNGASADAIGFPGYDTISASTVPIFTSDGSGAFTASEIADIAAGGVTVGSPTGGQKGAGSLNAAALFVNGVAVSTGGTVTSIATTSPITGGTITTTGTIACATCVTSAAALTSTAIVIGGGLQATSTDASATLSAGALALGASGTIGTVTLGNATSGTGKLQTVAGALTTPVWSLPNVTGNIVTTGDSGTVTGTMIASATVAGSNIVSSAALAGSPTTTTQAANDNSTKIATTAYADRVSTPAFSGLTSGTNAAAAMVVGTGASLGVAGTGTIQATSVTSAATGTTQSQNDNSTKLATTAYVDRAPTFATGTTHTFAGPADYFECTGTCTITMPTPAAGVQYCMRNANNVATVITISGLASVLYENTNFTSYKSANTAIASSGAAGDRMCYVGKDSTHYDVFSFNGTWS